MQYIESELHLANQIHYHNVFSCETTTFFSCTKQIKICVCLKSVRQHHSSVRQYQTVSDTSPTSQRTVTKRTFFSSSCGLWGMRLFRDKTMFVFVHKESGITTWAMEEKHEVWPDLASIRFSAKVSYTFWKVTSKTRLKEIKWVTETTEIH